MDATRTPSDRGPPPNQGSAGRKDPDRLIIENAGGITAEQGEKILALIAEQLQATRELAKLLQRLVANS